MALTAFRLESLDLQGKKIQRVIFDLPDSKVNTFGEVAIREIEELIPLLQSKYEAKECDLILFASGKRGNFIAGADIKLFQKATTPEQAAELSTKFQEIVSRFEDLKPIKVVAIEGSCLGGGCEFSLGMDAMLASDDPSTKIGLPEVNLGVLPGGGGCVRMPRKVGLATALDLILTGKSLDAKRAYRAGLVEAVIAKENFMETALQWCMKNWDALNEGKRLAPKPNFGGMGGPIGTALEKTAPGRMFMLKKAKDGVLAKTRGHYPGPIKILEVLSKTSAQYGPRLKGRDRDEALAIEAKAFGELAAGDVAKNLIRLFFMTEEVKKQSGVAGVDAKSLSKINTGAVLGAGVMGGGIAQLLADKKIPVRMKDITTQALATGIAAATKVFAYGVKKRKISKREFLQRLNLISPSLDFQGFQSVDCVIEAVVENMDVKKKVLADLEKEVRPDCIIATNTSSLSVTEMQTALTRSERFVGMHFFNPVHRMPLIEVIQAQKTDPRAVAVIYELSKRLGKTPIVVKDAPGFLVNRLLMSYLNEASYLLAEGGLIEEIDKMVLDFGMPMGPFELIDEVGIDVGDKVAHVLFEQLGERMKPSEVNHKVKDSGRLGKKNKKGFYAYNSQSKKESVDSEVQAMFPGGKRFDPTEVVDRCILPMINEAARCLEEKVVERAEDVDLGMIMGTGFPPFRGGLLRYADSVGIPTLIEKLKHYESTVSPRFKPSEAILKMASEGRTFYRNT